MSEFKTFSIRARWPCHIGSQHVRQRTFKHRIGIIGGHGGDGEPFWANVFARKIDKVNQKIERSQRFLQVLQPSKEALCAAAAT